MSGRGAVHDYGSDIYTEAEGSDDTLANLGPLGPLAGIWTTQRRADMQPARDAVVRPRRAARDPRAPELIGLAQGVISL